MTEPTTVADGTAPKSDPLNVGDPIWYRHAQQGGYRWASDVPGILVQKDGKRWRVEVFKKDGSTTRISVLATNVRRRDPEAVWK